MLLKIKFKKIVAKIRYFFLDIFIFENLYYFVIFLFCQSYFLLNSDLLLIILLSLLFILINFYLIVFFYLNLNNTLNNINILFLKLIRKTLDSLWFIRHYYRRYYTLHLFWNSLLLFGKNFNLNLFNFYKNTIYLKNNILNKLFKYNLIIKNLNNYKKLI